MTALTADTVITLGSWSRFARVLLIGELGDDALALVDTNGDGVELNLSRYHRDEDAQWQEGSSSIADDRGAVMLEGRTFTWGRKRPSQVFIPDNQRFPATVAIHDKAYWGQFT